MSMYQHVVQIFRAALPWGWEESEQQEVEVTCELIVIAPGEHVVLYRCAC